MASKAGSRRGLIVSIVGVVLVILGILWSWVIFPALEKIPTDYERSYYFDGAFTVLNPVTQSYDTFPIEQTLDQEAVGTEDGALLIHEVRTIVNAQTGDDLSAIYGDESTLAIDRSSLEFVPEIDERGRTGNWAPPKSLEPGDSFDLWNPGASRPLTANYVEDTEFRDLHVKLFEIDETDILIGTEPTSGADLLYSTNIRLWIEPWSGTVVNQEADTTTSIDMFGNKVPVVISSVQYAEETIVDLMDTGRSARTFLLWLKGILPWLLVGIGIVLVLVGIFLGRRRRVPQEVPSGPVTHEEQDKPGG
jgi:hypothetical protein